MSVNGPPPKSGSPVRLDLSEDDIYAAMKKIPGYLDITPGDFKEVYLLAFQEALERLRRRVTARDVMTREVIAVSQEAPLSEVAAAMGARGISGVPVVDGMGKVMGVISEKDFLAAMGVGPPHNFMTLVASCLKAKGCIALPIKKRKAADLMSSPAITVTEATPMEEIAQIFTTRNLNRVPVTDAEGHLRGIVTRGDLVQATFQGAEL